MPLSGASAANFDIARQIPANFLKNFGEKEVGWEKKR
jgi:hypothetical protein